jgi:hypothetical protein
MDPTTHASTGLRQGEERRGFWRSFPIVVLIGVPYIGLLKRYVSSPFVQGLLFVTWLFAIRHGLDAAAKKPWGRWLVPRRRT